MAEQRAAIAAGHPETLAAAEAILRAGGNAFDAVAAGLLAACVVEPVLASLGGGGFLLASPAAGSPQAFDFFVQTPRARRVAGELDFRELFADFGPVRQSFHVGRGSVATPGVLRGLFAFHPQLGRMPTREIFVPAIRLAAQGTTVRAFDAHVMEVVGTIFGSTADSARIYGSPGAADRLLQPGELMRLPELAGTLEAIAHEGPDLLYRGEIARRIVEGMREGGHLRLEDLEGYRVERRTPLAERFDGFDLRLAPPPSSGGVLVAFGLDLLGSPDLPHGRFLSPEHVAGVLSALILTAEARLDVQSDAALAPEMLRRPDLVERYRAECVRRARAWRGTTHLSVLDREGNAASLSVSNGESSGYVVPGTGVALNNMLGEADLNPRGFHRWGEDERMTSMMSPVIGRTPEGAVLCLGSGGSNRIRSAVLQTLVNRIRYERELEEAVDAPRVHYEPAAEGEGLLSLEGGLDLEALAPALEPYPERTEWAERDMFFGGVHAVDFDGDRTAAAGDPRRGGVGAVI